MSWLKFVQHAGFQRTYAFVEKSKKSSREYALDLKLGNLVRPTTVIDGMEDKNINLASIAQKLKTYCACGGTSKNGQIMLQGDHRDRIREFLLKLGYPSENIEVQ